MRLSLFFNRWSDRDHRWIRLDTEAPKKTKVSAHRRVLFTLENPKNLYRVLWLSLIGSESWAFEWRHTSTRTREVQVDVSQGGGGGGGAALSAPTIGADQAGGRPSVCLWKHSARARHSVPLNRGSVRKKKTRIRELFRRRQSVATPTVRALKSAGKMRRRHRAAAWGFFPFSFSFLLRQIRPRAVKPFSDP